MEYADTGFVESGNNLCDCDCQPMNLKSIAQWFLQSRNASLGVAYQLLVAG